MKKIVLMIAVLFLALYAKADGIKITSPDGKTTVIVENENGKPSYKVLLEQDFYQKFAFRNKNQYR